MPVLRVKSYHTSQGTGNGIRYTKDPDKTGIPVDQMPLSEASLARVFTYSANPEKTEIPRQGDGEKELLIYGHHCDPELAEQEFALLKERYLANGHKDHTVYAKAKRPLRAKLDENGVPIKDENGEYIYDRNSPVLKDQDGNTVFQTFRKEKRSRDAYMFVLSFPGKEHGVDMDPRQALRIAREYVQKTLKDDFAAVITIHCNTDHIHAHIVASAYSLDGTRKWQDNMKTLRLCRDISDEIAQSYGIPVILNPEQGKSISRREHRKIRDGESWKETLREKIREAARLAESPEDFVRRLKDVSVGIRETANHYTYIYTNEQGKEVRCRDNRLNRNGDSFDYTKPAVLDEIRKEWERVPETHKDPAAVPHTQTKKREMPVSLFVPYYDLDGNRLNELQRLLIGALKVVTLIKDSVAEEEPHTAREGLQNADKKIRNLQEALEILSSRGIGDLSTLKTQQQAAGIRVSVLKKKLRETVDIDPDAAELIRQELMMAKQEYQTLKKLADSVARAREELREQDDEDRAVMEEREERSEKRGNRSDPGIP